MSPLVQTKTQIYLPGGGGGGGTHGGSQELSINDRLGASRISTQEIQAMMSDASFVNFSSPESLGAQLDNGTLLYTAFELNGAIQEVSQFRFNTLESNLGFDDTAHSIVLKLTDTLAAQSEIQNFSVLVTDTQGVFVEAGQLKIRTQETNGVINDQFSAAINLASIETQDVFNEVLSAVIRTAESNGIFTEVSRFTIDVYANAVVTSAGWNSSGPATQATDNNLNTSAFLGAKATGIGGATSLTLNANMDIDFPDFPIGELTILSVHVHAHDSGQRTGAALVGGGATITRAYSINNTNYTALPNSSGDTSGVGFYWDYKTNPLIIDLTSIINTQTMINTFRYRTTAQTISGTGTNAETKVDVWGVILRVVLTG